MVVVVVGLPRLTLQTYGNSLSTATENAGELLYYVMLLAGAAMMVIVSSCLAQQG